MGFHGGSSGKESSYNAGDLGSIPELGRSPGEENGYPLLPGQFHGQRSLVGYSPIICSILYWLRFEDDIVNYLSESLFLKKNTFILFPPGPLSIPLGYPQPVWEGWHNEESNPPEEPGGLTWKQSDVTELVKTWSRVVSAEKAIKKKMRKMLNI